MIAIMVTILQFIAGLSIIVGIHELGHLLFAKLFKVRVYHFMIGFPPKIFKFKFKDTEYSLGAVPLGGAVKIAGMADESLLNGNESDDRPGWAFSAKPPWQRLLIILGGILFNLVSAVLIYIFSAYLVGQSYLATSQVNKYGVLPDDIGRKIGFEPGDRLLKINGTLFENFSDFMSPSLLLTQGSYYTIERAGEEFVLPIPEETMVQMMDKKKMRPFLYPLVPFLIHAVTPSGAAALGGVQVGDEIISVGQNYPSNIDEWAQLLAAHKGGELTITYLRGGIPEKASIQLNRGGSLGLQVTKIPLPFKRVSYSFLTSIGVGLREIGNAISDYYLSIWALIKWALIKGKLPMKKFVGGPISIAAVFGDEFISSRFWKLIGYFSLTIALTNLLPIPLLDGCHALFIVYEWVLGHKPSERFLEVTSKLGFVILLLLMFYAFSNDIYRLIH